MKSIHSKNYKCKQYAHETDYEDIEAITVGDAAECFVESIFTYEADYYEVEVRDPEDKRWLIVVDVESSPSFRASKVKLLLS
jgi:hypothetical protein